MAAVGRINHIQINEQTRTSATKSAKRNLPPTLQVLSVFRLILVCSVEALFPVEGISMAGELVL